MGSIGWWGVGVDIGTYNNSPAPSLGFWEASGGGGGCLAVPFKGLTNQLVKYTISIHLCFSLSLSLLKPTTTTS